MSKNEECKCRWCEGEGVLVVGIGDGPDIDDVEMLCPECVDGDVSAAIHMEQHDMADSYIDDLYDRLAQRIVESESDRDWGY